MKTRRHLLAFSSCLLALADGGCGGGGGGGGGSASASVPTATPAPAPTPAPSPAPPATGFDDAEFRSSLWLVANNALPAFEAGATGRGVTIAIIDSGVNATNADLAGRVSPASRGSLNVEGHGTDVAMIAAGARNGGGTMGVAFEATILSYDTERCPNDCFHSIDDVASAVDDAVQRGARVINMSIVGGGSREPLFGALRRAAAAGVVVVIAAGNEPGGPEGFGLQNAQQTASSLIVLAGAHDSDRRPTSLGSPAGTGAPWYLSAYSFNATSFSAPVISGAVALLAGAFPNLSGAQIVAILMATAQDAGPPGPDAVFGNGILDIGRAYAAARTASGG